MYGGGSSEGNPSTSTLPTTKPMSLSVTTRSDDNTKVCFQPREIGMASICGSAILIEIILLIKQSFASIYNYFQDTAMDTLNVIILVPISEDVFHLCSVGAQGMETILHQKTNVKTCV